jgi:hypothetical protein
MRTSGKLGACTRGGGTSPPIARAGESIELRSLLGFNSNPAWSENPAYCATPRFGSCTRVVGLFLRSSARQLAVGLSLSAVLAIVVLVVISQGFSIGAGEVAMIGLP